MIVKSSDTFNISNGNLMVLQTIPKMMVLPHWRKKLRALVLDFIIECEILHKREKKK
jgi:hypothetical protein